MPSFLQLLEDSMPFAAARHESATLLEITGQDFYAPEPHPIDPRGVPLDPEWLNLTGVEAVVKNNRIWQFDHRASEPATFENLRVWSRGMGMNYSHPLTVATRIVVDDLIVTPVGSDPVQLPLTADFVVGTWRVAGGEIPASSVGWWQLEAKTDVALLVAFVYDEQDGELVPMPRDDVEALGDAFMPGPLPAFLEFLVTCEASARICIGNTRHIALVSLTTCRERPDFVGADLFGFARLYPHVMLMSTTEMHAAEVRIRFQRPPTAMSHGDPEMNDEVRALLVSDSNRSHSITRFFAEDKPVPLTSNIYDYYAVDPDRMFRERLPLRLSAEARSEHGDDAKYMEDHPEQHVGEITLADSRFIGTRMLDDCVSRDGGKWENIRKEPRQGQFDNVHMAPRMRMKFDQYDRLTGEDLGAVVLDDIAMVFVCLHDCLHMHVRWAAFATNKEARGFDGSNPYAAAGRPAVPENQTVFASFSTRHTLDYRAVAAEPIPGRWQVFCHHGAGQAIDAWPDLASQINIELMRTFVFRADGYSHTDPYPTMPETWSAFYWRCRWMEDLYQTGIVVERLVFSLHDCMR